MEEQNNPSLSFFYILKKIREVDNYNLSLMSREERIQLIIAEMERIEKEQPDMVEYIEDLCD